MPRSLLYVSLLCYWRGCTQNHTTQELNLPFIEMKVATVVFMIMTLSHAKLRQVRNKADIKFLRSYPPPPPFPLLWSVCVRGPTCTTILTSPSIHLGQICIPGHMLIHKRLTVISSPPSSSPCTARGRHAVLW